MQESFAIFNQFVEQYKALIQILGLGTSLFGVAWFFRAFRADLFALLEKITNNHLAHIQQASEKSAVSLAAMQVGFAAHDMRAVEIEKEIEDFRQEVRSRPSECPLVPKEPTK